MRTFPKLMVLLVVLLVGGCAGTSQYMRKAEPPTGPPPEKALVYFMRPSGMGFAVHFQIWDGHQLIGLSQAKSYFAYPCDPGKHLFIGIAENKRGVEAELEAGKSYYVLTQVKMGAWRARMAFIPVTRGSEYWEKVEAYKQELEFIEPNEEELANWLAPRKAKAENELMNIISYLNTPEGSQYVVTLSKDDGR